MPVPKRILFFTEAVTLAHLARPVALAKSLDTARYAVLMAHDARYRRFLEQEPLSTLPLHSITTQQFLRALASGRPVYHTATLRRYVAEDLALIEQSKPDIIVGDFRLSLSISARLVGIPYVTITNAYWSQYYLFKEFPLPVLPMTRVLPLAWAKTLFRLAQPWAFALHTRPLNRVRRENGLFSLGSDLRRIYGDADYILYADVPVLFPTETLPGNHDYLGPILWSPQLPRPAWWNQLPTDKPIIYLTLGSSGQATLLPLVLSALSNLPVTVMLATAGAAVPAPLPKNVYVADYIPGTEAAARAALVICNGGSPTSQQALTAGVPVLGIASNMDQFMNMEALARAAVGHALRSDRLEIAPLRALVVKMLADTTLKQNAASLAEVLSAWDASRRFNTFMDRITGFAERFD